MEKYSIDRLRYQRFEFPSKNLNRNVPFGKLREDKQDKDISGTLYLFHGGDGNDLQPLDIGLFARLPKRLLDLILNNGVQIVFPYIGTSFLHEHPTDPKRSISQWFFDELIQKVEAGTQTQDKTRWISGYSMGGQAALNAFFRKPAMFQGVGAHFPTLVGFDYSMQDEAQKFQKRTGISDSYLKILVDGFNEFQSRKDFLAHDPLTLAEQAIPKNFQGKTIYFDCGSADEFGLFEGARHLSQVLRRKKISHTFEEVAEGHHNPDFLLTRFQHLISALLDRSQQP